MWPVWAEGSPLPTLPANETVVVVMLVHYGHRSVAGLPACHSQGSEREEKSITGTWDYCAPTLVFRSVGVLSTTSEVDCCRTILQKRKLKARVVVGLT